MAADNIKAGIVGSAGYTGGELIRLLLGHPNVEIAFAHSQSNAGKKIYEVHEDLFGETELEFTDSLDAQIDVLFLCLGHGDSAPFLEEHDIPEGITIIDLSQDFRLNRDKHDFVYGLPELQPDAIRKARHIANPGCFASAIQLALLPLATEGLIQYDIHVTAITGSTGAGQKPRPTTHFSWRDNNLSVYKAFRHQHRDEIELSIKQLQPGYGAGFNFVPIRGDFPRGILASVYLSVKDISDDEARRLYCDYYEEAAFTYLYDKQPNLKQVVNTNRCLVHVEKHDDILHIVSVLDNLVKGASGQAVQNMNLVFGLEETAGLRLKPLAL